MMDVSGHAVGVQLQSVACQIHRQCSRTRRYIRSISELAREIFTTNVGFPLSSAVGHGVARANAPELLGMAVLGTRLINTDYNNFAPRFGIAYSPSDKWSFRTGFGIFYSLRKQELDLRS